MRADGEKPQMIRQLAAGAALSALVLAAPSLAARAHAQDAPSAAAFDPPEATVAVDAGNDDGAFLYGSLMKPPGKAKYPMVLILPEAGADRNGNTAAQEVKPDTYRDLALGLAAKGVASVRIDKRGVGDSAKTITREDDLRFDTYVDDAVRWIKFAQAQPGVGCLAVFGHSESALVAALAAKKIKVCAIVSASGPGRPAAAILATQLKTYFDAGRLSKDDYDTAIRILNQLAAGKPVTDTPKKLDSMFRQSVQPYLISWLPLNPVEALKTNTPVLILQGSGDLEMSTDDARKLSAAPKNVKVVMIPGADHDLKIKTPQKGGLMLSPQASAAIATFLDSLRWP